MSRLCSIVYAIGVLVVLAGADPARAEASVGYVALGDSFTAAPLISLPQFGSPPGCLRSDRNYPSLIAARLHPVSFTDVSCSGAETRHMTTPQILDLGTRNPAQFDALKPGTTLVTLTIGGNDIGFGQGLACFTLSFSDPGGSPCRNMMTRGGVDRFAVNIATAAPKVGAVLRGISRRSPRATVLLLEYPLIMPATGPGCFPRLPLAKGDVAYLRQVQAMFNGMLVDQAARSGSTIVDDTAPGHDACQPDPAKRWIEGIPARWAAPAHPNALGARAMADLALAALRRIGGPRP